MNDITQETVNLIKNFEGLRLIAYLDSVGIPTIGYGHTKGVKLGMKITEMGARQMLIDDLAIAAAGVNRAIKKPMTDYEFGAFLSLTHNIGVGGRQANGRLNGFLGSTAARKFNAGDKGGAAEAILMWNKITVDGKKVVSRGLTNRREVEVVYFIYEQNGPRNLEYETAAGMGGEHRAVPPAWPMLGVIAATIALFWEQVKEFFNGIPQIF